MSNRGMTLEEIGKEFGVTRETIRQTEARAIWKLRRPYQSRKLMDFVDSRDPDDRSGVPGCRRVPPRWPNDGRARLRLDKRTGLLDW